MTDDTFLPKAAADAGDEIVDLVFDAIDQEPPELRDQLIAAIRRRDYSMEQHPDGVHAKFPTERIEYLVPLVRVPSRSTDRLN